MNSVSQTPTSGSKSVLVPVDFSKASREAFRQARALTSDASRITLLHVVTKTDGKSPVFGSAFERDILKSCEADAADGQAPEVLIRAGTPFQEILAVAQEKAVEMIVMAVHETPSLAGLGLGHTVERVSRYAKCPVLLVRESGELATRGG